MDTDVIKLYPFFVMWEPKRKQQYPLYQLIRDFQNHSHTLSILLLSVSVSLFIYNIVVNCVF